MNARFFLVLILSSSLLLVNSCTSFQKKTYSEIEQAQINAKPESEMIPPVQVTKLKQLNCDQLKEMSAKPDFALKHLAGVRAQKICKDFKYDTKNIPDFEKRLFADEINDVDPTIPASTEVVTADQIKKQLRDETNPTEILKLYKQLRQRYKNANRKNDSLKATTDMYNWALKNWKDNKENKSAQEILLESSLIISRSLWSENKTQKAEDILNQTMRHLKNQISLAEIYFLSARIDEEKGEFEKALDNYDLALEEFKKGNVKTISFTKEKILWVKSWILYKNERWALAEQAFKALLSENIDTSEKSKVRFFLSRALNKQNKKDESVAVLNQLKDEDSFSYYGLVSYQELGQKIPAFNTLKPKGLLADDLELKFLPAEQKLIFTELLNYEEIDLAEKMIPLVSKALENNLSMAVHVARRGQRYLPLFAAFAKLNNDSKIDALNKYGDLLFPRIYENDVKTMSEKTELPPSLIYSIMKQESAFNMRTRSHADAMGLMQVIPRLAKHLAKKYSVPYKKPADLYDPQINIQLGSYELADQVKKQNGQLTFVAAAYNAGPYALQNWLKTKWRDHFDVIDFIEEIPFEETRTYVKVIARNKLFYDRLARPEAEHNFPIEFIKKMDSSSQDKTAQNGQSQPESEQTN